MKKLILTFFMVLASFACFADNYINFTIPLRWGFYFQDKKSSEYYDYNEFIWSYGATAEYFHTFSGAFGIGLKGSVNKCKVSVDFDTDGGYYNGNSIGWNVAPTFGWAFSGEGTKKKINLYPIVFERFSFTDLDGSSSLQIPEDNKLVLTNYKFGATFSWQWGNEGVQNGLEFGFSFPWDGMLEYDGKTIAKSGYGFDFHLAYKISLYMPKL